RKVTSLSAGELQKVMLARAIAGDAGLLVFDEPFANLDLAASLNLCGIFRDLVRAGRTLLASMHDLNLAARFSDRLMCLRQGTVYGVGTPRELLTPTALREA